MARKLTIQDRRSELDIPCSAEDAQSNAYDDTESDERYWEWYDYWNPWTEDVMPEWTRGLGLSPDTYWHPWSEPPSSI